jgi:hypothetical protein
MTRSAAEALTNQVGHLDEEGPTVAPETWFEIARESIEAVAIEVVVVAGVECGARIWGPAEQELTANVRCERVVINAGPRKNEARELISPAQRVDVVIKSYQAGIVTTQPRLGIVERHSQRVGWLIGKVTVEVKRTPGARIESYVLAKLDCCRAGTGIARAAAKVVVHRSKTKVRI